MGELQLGPTGSYQICFGQVDKSLRARLAEQCGEGDPAPLPAAAPSLSCSSPIVDAAHAPLSMCRSGTAMAPEPVKCTLKTFGTFSTPTFGGVGEPFNDGRQSKHSMQCGEGATFDRMAALLPG